MTGRVKRGAGDVRPRHVPGPRGSTGYLNVVHSHSDP